MAAMLFSFIFAFESVPDRYCGLNLCLLQFCYLKELRHLINITFIIRNICITLDIQYIACVAGIKRKRGIRVLESAFSRHG